MFLLQTGNKKEAEKLVKNIIKIIIKLAVLYRNNQFTNEEMKSAERFKFKFHSIAMAVISFYEVTTIYNYVIIVNPVNIIERNCEYYQIFKLENT